MEDHSGADWVICRNYFIGFSGRLTTFMNFAFGAIRCETSISDIVTNVGGLRYASIRIKAKGFPLLDPCFEWFDDFRSWRFDLEYAHISCVSTMSVPGYCSEIVLEVFLRSLLSKYTIPFPDLVLALIGFVLMAKCGLFGFSTEICVCVVNGLELLCCFQEIFWLMLRVVGSCPIFLASLVVRQCYLTLLATARIHWYLVDTSKNGSWIASWLNAISICHVRSGVSNCDATKCFSFAQSRIYCTEVLWSTSFN